jgi:hypothetical protein
MIADLGSSRCIDLILHFDNHKSTIVNPRSNLRRRFLFQVGDAQRLIHFQSGTS